MLATNTPSLGSVLAALREAGLSLGPEETLRTYALVRGLASEAGPQVAVEPTTFRRLLAAAVARSAEDRALVDRVLDALERKTEVALELGGPPRRIREGGDSRPPAVRPAAPRPSGAPKRRWPWLLVPLTALAVGLFAWSLRGSAPESAPSPPEPVPAPTPSASPAPGPAPAPTPEIARPTQFRTRELVFSVTHPSVVGNPWLFGALGLGASVTALGLGLWFHKKRWLPVPEVPTLRPGPRVAPLLPLESRAPGLLGIGEREDLAFAVDRFVRDEPSPDLDVPRSIEATVQAAFPTVVFHPRVEHRAVWLWSDSASQSPLVPRFVAEVRDSLVGAGLPCERARYWLVPDVLEHEDQGPLSPHDLDQAAHGSIVLLVTDGTRLAERLARPATLARCAPIFRRLARWPRAALVVVREEGRRALEGLTERFGLTVLAPEEVQAFLAGQDPGPREPAAPLGIVGNVRLWAAACALSERPVDARSALALRGAMGLAVPPWAFDVMLGECGGARETLAPSPPQRGEWLSWLGATTAPGDSKTPIPSHTALGRALDFWRERLGGARGSVGDLAEPPLTETEAERGLRAARARLSLWDRPDAAALTLYRLFGAAPEHERRQVLAHYAVRARSNEAVKTPPGDILLPWALRQREAQTQVILEELGIRVLSAKQERSRFELPSRVLLGLGLSLGLALGAGLIGAGKWLLRPRGAPTCEGPPRGWCEVLEVPGAENQWTVTASRGGTPTKAPGVFEPSSHIRAEDGAEVWRDEPSGPITNSSECPYREETVGGIVLVRICGGTFLMGTDRRVELFNRVEFEAPAHAVTISTFWLGKHEVSAAQYNAHDPQRAPPEHPNWPAVAVAWYDAQAFCERLGLRLPTEAEWEYAARGPEGRAYPWGNERQSKARAAYGMREPVDVSSFSDVASPFGTLNQIGNAQEWGLDCTHSYPPATEAPLVDPIQGNRSQPMCLRALRGGSFFTLAPGELESWRRGQGWDNSKPSGTVGFRCARGGSREP